ncbi:MAG: hypothetical protein KR126chlam3_00769 [Chlamydiae bacterium]|nr:hypothetical protein [Chlamydiota bacterium]
MKLKIILCFSILCLGLSGCFQAHSDDDLRGVPVTNNPNLIPKTGQTVQGPSF